jgi:hypothetical protein
MARDGWIQEGRTTMHPVCPFFIVEQEVPEIAARGKQGLVEYHVLRGGGDDSAAFSLAIFSTLDEAIADAERREAEARG